MIKKLQNNDVETAKKTFYIFQESYAVEAKLLRAIDFPPLKRTLENYVTSTTSFFGYYENQDLAGVIEISYKTKFTHINSLVVDPKFFRQGIARKLIEFVFDTYDSNLFIVETGLENVPATGLYKSFGFKEVKQYDTDHGVRKIRFELHINE